MMMHWDLLPEKAKSNSKPYYSQLNSSDVQILNKGIIAVATNTDIAPDRSNK